MKGKCPGQDSSRSERKAVNLECPSCGRTVELFSDEGHRRCPCGTVVRRKALPKCSDWCPAAAECFGEATDVRVLKARVAQVRNGPRARQCLETIRERLRNREKREDDS